MIKKNTYKTPSANVLPNGEKRCFPSKIRTKLGMLSLTGLLNIIPEILANAVREEKEIKSIQIWNEEIKLFLLAAD